METCVLDGKIYSIGGTYYSEPVNTLEVYDPATDTWSRKADMPTARQGLSANVVNGKIYAIGGGDVSSYSNPKAFSTVEEYDPETDTWTTKTEMPTARGFHTANVIDGKIYVIGGSSGLPYRQIAILTVEVYDPATDTWTQKGDIPERIGAGHSSTINGKIYTFSGYNGFRKVYEYDPVADSWTRKSDISTGRVSPGTCVLNGKIYVMGGHTGVGPYYAMTDVEVYDPATDTWYKATDMITDRCGGRAGVVNGKIYIIGGYEGSFNSSMVATAEEYNPDYDLLPLIEQMNVDKSVITSGNDSVFITSEVSETEGISLYARILEPDQTLYDTIQLFDDGNHNDSAAGDGFYANTWQVSSDEEMEYSIYLEITRTGADTLTSVYNTNIRIITNEFVTIDDFAYEDVPLPGASFLIETRVKNNCSVFSAQDVIAVASCPDTVATVKYETMRFGDVDAGEVSNKRTVKLEISEFCPESYKIPVIITISSQGQEIRTDTINIELSVGINNARTSTIYIYPNPVNDILTIKALNSREAKLEIYNIAGIIVYRKDLRSSQETIDMSLYPEGIYLVKVNQGDAVKVEKIVVR